MRLNRNVEEFGTVNNSAERNTRRLFVLPENDPRVTSWQLGKFADQYAFVLWQCGGPDFQRKR